jgi:hypothetical protein
MSYSDPSLSSIAKALKAISKQLELIHSDLKRVNSDVFKRPHQIASDAQEHEDTTTEESQQTSSYTASRSSASRPDPSIDQSENASEKHWNAKYWKSQLDSVRLAEWLEILGIVVLIGYTTVTFLQLRAANESNRFSQRASINIGLPSGELAHFIQDGTCYSIRKSRYPLRCGSLDVVEYRPGKCQLDWDPRREPRSGLRSRCST